jgi:hypothetical protein
LKFNLGRNEVDFIHKMEMDSSIFNAISMDKYSNSKSQHSQRSQHSDHSHHSDNSHHIHQSHHSHQSSDNTEKLKGKLVL